MGYSSYKRHLTFTDDKNVCIDGCGNTYEDKYYYNGTYIDLCGLPIEEYMKNYFFCDDNNGGGSSNTKPTNKITVESYEENGVVYYRAISTMPVTEKLQISVILDDDSTTVLDIEIGETTSKPEIGTSIDIKKVSLNVYEDETYIYTTQIKNNKAMYKIYSKAILLRDISKINDMIKDFDVVETEVSKTNDITFLIPGTDYDYSNIEEDEFEQYCKENQYCFIISLPIDVYNNKEYFIYLEDINCTDLFINKTTVTLQDGKYIILVKQAKEGEEATYTPAYLEDVKHLYKLTLK